MLRSNRISVLNLLLYSLVCKELSTRCCSNLSLEKLLVPQHVDLRTRDTLPPVRIAIYQSSQGWTLLADYHSTALTSALFKTDLVSFKSDASIDPNLSTGLINNLQSSNLPALTPSISKTATIVATKQQRGPPTRDPWTNVQLLHRRSYKFSKASSSSAAHAAAAKVWQRGCCSNATHRAHDPSQK